MGRPPRLHAAGTIHHVIARGNGGQTLFFTDADYRAFLRMLELARERFGFLLHSYCLMPNHIHLLIEVGGDPISLVMQALLARYARYFNRRHGRRGHVFQSRFKSPVCADDRHILTLVRYIHLNPVRAGLAVRPGDWPWSSHHDYMGKPTLPTVSTRRVLSILGTSEDHARRGYDEIMTAGAECLPVSAKEEGDPTRGGTLAGPAERPGRHASLQTLAAELGHAGEAGVAFLRAASRAAAVVAARTRFAQEAAARGFSLRETARFLDMAPSTVSRALSLASGRSSRGDGRGASTRSELSNRTV